ncbi:MAG TPA: signal peptide peptidase SppA [Kofleriaceae bacterium]
MTAPACARWLPILLALAACRDSPSKLDTLGECGQSSTSSASDSGDKKDSPLGGMDVQGMLTKIGEAIKKPGPYEAPDQSADFSSDKPHWGTLELSGDIVERQAYSWKGGSGTELRMLTQRLGKLATDPNLIGLVLRVGGVKMSLPDAMELRRWMIKFKEANKKIVCHTEDADNTSYMLLSLCDTLALAPLGQIAITGPAAMPIHIKPLLDKFGVTADFLHVGAYKGAAEPLTRDAPSDEMKETLGAILDGRYETMVANIAAGRKLEPAKVKELIDTGLFPSPQALQAKLVDDVMSYEEFRAKYVTGPWGKLELEPDASKDSLAAMMKIMRFVGTMPPEKPSGAHVAVVYALGDIVDGDGDGVLGARGQIASETLVAALRAITNDDSVKAVVLRVDSGGGSAQASELIWRAVNDLKAKKPVYVSMSDVAASGGYYISSGATKIFALDDTLTGSIGVVGGKISPGNALAKLGVNTFPMGRGKHATMMASMTPWDTDEKAIIQKSMQDVYDVFTGRVASGRKDKVKDVQAIAQGRVWTGKKAIELGLVDQIGGLDEVIAEASKAVNLPEDGAIEIYPPQPTLRDFLAGWGAVHAPFGLHASVEQDMLLSMVGTLSPDLAAEAQRMLKIALSFQTTTIQAVAVLPEIR